MRAMRGALAHVLGMDRAEGEEVPSALSAYKEEAERQGRDGRDCCLARKTIPGSFP